MSVPRRTSRRVRRGHWLLPLALERHAQSLRDLQVQPNSASLLAEAGARQLVRYARALRDERLDDARAAVSAREALSPPLTGSSCFWLIGPREIRELSR